MGPILAAVNSDYSFLADVANQERFREYDYGPGLGTSVEVGLEPRRGTGCSASFYRLQWINVPNGSIFNKTDERGASEGSDANHYLQARGPASSFPSSSAWAWGPTAWCVLRKSHYGSARSWRTRTSGTRRRAIYLAFDLGH